MDTEKIRSLLAPEQWARFERSIRHLAKCYGDAVDAFDRNDFEAALRAVALAGDVDPQFLPDMTQLAAGIGVDFVQLLTAAVTRDPSKVS